MRCQAALEYLLLCVMALGLLVPIFMMLSDSERSAKSEVNLAYAKSLADKLKENANFIYSQGEPASVILSVYVPDSVENIRFAGKTVVIDVALDSGFSNITRECDCNLTGIFPAAPGRQSVVVKARGGVVNITAI